MTQHTETPNLSPFSPKGEANSFWALSHLLFGEGTKHAEGDGGIGQLCTSNNLFPKTVFIL